MPRNHRITASETESWSLLLEQFRGLRRHTSTVYNLAHDSYTPKPAKLVATLVSAYALSPIGFIPSFIPVLGLLDDLVLLPLGVWLVIWLTPRDIWDAARSRASVFGMPPQNRFMAALIVFLWVLIFVSIIYKL